MAPHPPPVPLAPPASRPPARRLVEPVLAPPAPPRVGPVVARPAAAEAVPEPARRAAHRVARALAEVVQGRRPPAQLDGLMAPAAAAVCEGLAGAAAGLKLRSVRLQMPTPDSVELAVHLADGRRSQAAALRLEARDSSWRCVAVEVASAARGVSPSAACGASGGWPAGGPSPAPGARVGSPPPPRALPAREPRASWAPGPAPRRS